MSNEEDTVTLTDQESVLLMKAIRNNPFNHMSSLTFEPYAVKISFMDATLDTVSIPIEEVMEWKDREWTLFFSKHEPLM